FVRMLGPTVFRFRHLGLIDVRLQRDALARRHPRRAHGTTNRVTPTDARRNLLCELLTVRSSLHVLSLGRIREKTAFHKYCRNSCFSQNIETAATHSAIGRRRASRDIIVNGRSERQALAAKKICFDATGVRLAPAAEIALHARSVIEKPIISRRSRQNPLAISDPLSATQADGRRVSGRYYARFVPPGPR